MKLNNPVYVTRPDLPLLEKSVKSLREIRISKRLANNGSFHEKLEHAR